MNPNQLPQQPGVGGGMPQQQPGQMPQGMMGGFPPPMMMMPNMTPLMMQQQMQMMQQQMQMFQQFQQQQAAAGGSAGGQMPAFPMMMPGMMPGMFGMAPGMMPQMQPQMNMVAKPTVTQSTPPVSTQPIPSSSQPPMTVTLPTPTNSLQPSPQPQASPITPNPNPMAMPMSMPMGMPAMMPMQMPMMGFNMMQPPIQPQPVVDPAWVVSKAAPVTAPVAPVVAAPPKADIFNDLSNPSLALKKEKFVIEQTKVKSAPPPSAGVRAEDDEEEDFADFASADQPKADDFSFDAPVSAAASQPSPSPSNHQLSFDPEPVAQPLVSVAAPIVKPPEPVLSADALMARSFDMWEHHQSAPLVPQVSMSEIKSHTPSKTPATTSAATTSHKSRRDMPQDLDDLLSNLVGSDSSSPAVSLPTLGNIPAPAPVATTTNTVEEEDDDEEFGDFSSTAAVAAPMPPATNTFIDPAAFAPTSSFTMPSSSYPIPTSSFMPTPAAAPAFGVAAEEEEEEEEEDFADFASSSPAITAAAPTTVPFSSYTEPVTVPSTAVVDDDDEGDFGDFASTNATQSLQSPPPSNTTTLTTAVVEDEDEEEEDEEEFADFSSAPPAAATSQQAQMLDFVVGASSSESLSAPVAAPELVEPPKPKQESDLIGDWGTAPVTKKKSNPFAAAAQESTPAIEPVSAPVAAAPPASFDDVFGSLIESDESASAPSVLPDLLPLATTVPASKPRTTSISLAQATAANVIPAASPVAKFEPAEEDEEDFGTFASSTTTENVATANESNVQHKMVPSSSFESLSLQSSPPSIAASPAPAEFVFAFSPEAEALTLPNDLVVHSVIPRDFKLASRLIDEESAPSNLDEAYAMLLRQERFSEAAKCALQKNAASELATLSTAYKAALAAAEEDESEDGAQLAAAMKIQKQIKQLKALKPEESWLRTKLTEEEERTTPASWSQIHRSLVQLDPEWDAFFTSIYPESFSEVATKQDVPTAITQQTEANAFLRVILGPTSAELPTHLERLTKVINYINQQLQTAATFVQETSQLDLTDPSKQSDFTTLLSSPSSRTHLFLTCVARLYRLALRLEFSTRLFSLGLNSDTFHESHQLWRQVLKYAYSQPLQTYLADWLQTEGVDVDTERQLMNRENSVEFLSEQRTRHSCPVCLTNQRQEGVHPACAKLKSQLQL